MAGQEGRLIVWAIVILTQPANFIAVWRSIMATLFSKQVKQLSDAIDEAQAQADKATDSVTRTFYLGKAQGLSEALRVLMTIPE